MSSPRPWLLALLLLAVGCDEDTAPPPATPMASAPAPDAGPGAQLARLEGLSGEVRLERGGPPGPAREGPLYEGDSVETGAGAAATVRLPDGRSVEVGSDARFGLGEDAGGIVMKVERGIVLSRVPAGTRTGREGMKVTLSILTPFGLTRVGSDTPSEVRVAVAPDAGRVEVRLGTIEFVSKDGQQHRAAEGEAVVVAARGVEVVRTPRVVELAPIPVTVRLGAGRAEVRPQGTVRWRPVKKQGEVLAPGDGVRTPPGGTAVLALEGSSSVLSLGSRTELVLESVGQGGNTDEARVDLRQGGLGLQLAAGRTSHVVLPGLGLEASGAAGLEVRRMTNGYRVEAFTGQVTLVRGASRQPLHAGERATLEGESGTAHVEPLSPAALALGPGDGTEVYHQGLSDVALTWEGEGEAVVEVAQDAGFMRTVVAGTVHRPFVNVSAPARGTLHWRVRRKDGTEVAKGSAAFAPERPSRDLDRVRNEVPEGPEKTTIFYQDKPPAVTFTYREESSAAKYRVAVYRLGALGTPVAERTVPDTRAALDAGALGEGSYLWSVTPLSASGTQLKGGRMNKLELVYDNSVPMLVVTSPLSGTPAAGKVRATGVAPVDAHLSINGRPAPLDGKHRFSTWVEPLGSPPLLVFKMRRPGAPEVYLVRTLKQRGP